MVITELSTGWAVTARCGPELWLVVELGPFTVGSSRAVPSVISVGGDRGVIDEGRSRVIEDDKRG